jgi:hypothetical protein
MRAQFQYANPFLDGLALVQNQDGAFCCAEASGAVV